jgi:hypothetical protein
LHVRRLRRCRHQIDVRPIAVIDPPFGICHLKARMLFSDAAECCYPCKAFSPDGRCPADLAVSAGQKGKVEVRDSGTAEHCSSFLLGFLLSNKAVSTCRRL